MDCKEYVTNLLSRYEKQVQQEEEAYQQQRRRLMAEVAEEKDRIARDAARQRGDVDKLQAQLQDKHSYAMEAMRAEWEKAREEQEKRHAVRRQCNMWLGETTRGKETL